MTFPIASIIWFGYFNLSFTKRVWKSNAATIRYFVKRSLHVCFMCVHFNWNQVILTCPDKNKIQANLKQAFFLHFWQYDGSEKTECSIYPGLIMVVQRSLKTPFSNLRNWDFCIMLLLLLLLLLFCWSRKTTLKFGQNRVSNTWDIADIEFVAVGGWVVVVVLQSHFRVKPNLG